MTNLSVKQASAEASLRTPREATPDENFYMTKLKNRFKNRSDWTAGRSILNDEYLVRRQANQPAKCVGPNRAKQPFEENTMLKVERISDPKIHIQMRHFFMTVCYAISMTSILEFPYMCYQHGGVTFMIPYLIMIILVGAPLMTVEMGLGQFCPLPIGSLFKAINLTYAGIGKAKLFVAFFRMLWNAERLVHAVYLAALSIPPALSIAPSPWTECNDKVNSDKCFDYLKYIQANCNTEANKNVELCAEYDDVMKRNLLDPTSRLTPMFLDYVKTQLFPLPFRTYQFALGPLGVNLTLVGVWIVVCIFAAWGVRRAAVVLIVTKIIGFCFIGIFCVISYNAEHARAGIKQFFEFKSDHLWDGSSWADAVTHVMLSLSLCDGTVHKLGSLSHFNTRYYRSILFALVFSIIYSVASTIMFFSCISAVTGYMYMHKPDNVFPLPRIHEFMGHGKILMFTALPEYLMSFNGKKPFIGIAAYYLAIAFITVPSVVMNLNKLITAFEWSNMYRYLWKLWPRRPVVKHMLITTAFSILLFPCIFAFVQPFGQVWKLLIKHQVMNALFVVGLAEILMIGFAYDAHRFIVDVNTMNKNIWILTAGFCLCCYYFATPFLMAAGCIYHFAFNQKSRVIDYVVPQNLILITLIVSLVVIAPILFHLVKRLVEMLVRNLSFRSIFQLTPYWIPPNAHDAVAARDGRLAYRAQSTYIKTKVAARNTMFVVSKSKQLNGK